MTEIPKRPQIEQSSRKMLIDGNFGDAVSGSTMPVFSPGDGRDLGAVPLAQAEDVSRAVSAASRAFPSWRYTDLGVRRRAVCALAEAIGRDAENLAYLDAIDSGSPIASMRRDTAMAQFAVEFIAGMAFQWGGRSTPVMGRSLNFTVREPHGVTARIIPFNHPIVFATWKIAAPLLTGNTVVLKLPDQTPLSGLRFAEQLAEIFPPGVLNIITGTGSVTGASLVSHPDVQRIAFIGSVETGTAIARKASERLLPVSMELGGKNPMVVCADADPEAAASAAVKGMSFSTQGQSCGSYSRLFLHDRLYDEVLDRVVKSVESIRVGHPLLESSESGALVDERALSKVQRHVDQARSDGATVRTGGGRPDDPELPALGSYYAPTVLADVTPAMAVAREEIFGPVLSVLRWNDREQLLSAVNGTEYGLTANVHTRDISLAHYLAERIEAGSIAINGDGTQHWFGAPFGGFKSSGTGKEDSIDELLESTREKNLNIQLSS